MPSSAVPPSSAARPPSAPRSGAVAGEIAIRPATAGDVPRILEIEQLSFVHAAERFDLRRVTYLVQSPRVYVAAAEADHCVLGWAAGFAWTKGVTPWGRVYSLAIHPEARGRKLGPKLLDHTIEELRRRGAGPIFLEVRPDNEPAVRLYEKFGFKTCRQLPDFYGEGNTAQRMVKDG